MTDTGALIGTELKTWPGSYFGGAVYQVGFNDANDSAVVIFQAPEATTITGMTASSQYGVGTRPFFKYVLQGVDSSGDPDGSNLAESAEFQPTDLADEAHAFTSPYTCTQGQLLCGRIIYSSGTIGGSNYANFNYATASVNANLLPYSQYWTGAAWYGANSFYPSIALQTGITGVDFGGIYNTGAVTSRLSITTSGDRFAQRVEIPADESLELHVDGFRYAGQVESSAGADVIVGIWPESGDPIVTTTIDTSQQLQQMADDPFSRDYMFTSTATLASGTVYYIGFQHAGGGSGDNLYISYANPGSANGLKSWPGGDVFYASAFSSSTWTDDVTKRLLLNPILSSIHGAGGGGSTTRPTMGVIG